jgi:hypothetical protein
MRVLLLLLLFIGCAQAAPTETAFPEVGGYLPAFILDDQDGRAVDQTLTGGHYAVVEFIRSGDW